jgi:signal transduction histidine kinase
MENLIYRYKEFVFGKDTTFDVQKKVFLLITHISIIIGIIGVIVDIVLGLGFLLTSVTMLALLVLIFFHIQVRNAILRPKHSLGFFITSVALFSVLWFYNGGYDGNNGVLIFVYFIVFITILPAKYRIYGLVIYSLMVFTLITVQFLRPDLITAYEFDHQRFIDLALGYFLYLILAYSIQNTILKNYEDDRKKIKIQNDQLNVLIEKQNDTNNKLEQSLNHVKELNSSKDRFITVLSHDLRSPFQGLLGITKILDSDYDSFSDAEKRLYISQVNSSVEKLYSFLEELLLWGRIQKNAVKLTYESTIVRELIIQTVSLISETAAKKKVSVEIVCDEYLKAVLDREMISIVLRNLISNAIKFSTVGGKILVNARLDGDHINISITDNGIGISEEFIPKLFRLDENVSTIGTDGEQGSGMGLILCSDILKKHNGEISVQSKEGKGSTFTIRVPQNCVQ